MSFFGEISLDPSKANRALDNVKAGGLGLDRALTKVGNSFGNKLFALFSGGAAIAGLKAMAEKVKDINELATSLSISTRQVQQLQDYAKETGKSFESMTGSAEELEESLGRVSGRMVKLSPGNMARVGLATGVGGDMMSGLLGALKESARAVLTGQLVPSQEDRMFQMGSIFGDDTGDDKATMDRMEAAQAMIREKAAQEKASRHMRKMDREVEEKHQKKAAELMELEKKVQDSEMTPSQRRQELRDEIEGLFAQIATEGDAFSPAGVGLRTQLAKSQLELLGIKDPVGDKELKDRLGFLKKRTLPTDSLRQVGNFLGSDPGAIARQELTTMKEIKSILQTIERNGKSSDWIP